MKRKQNLITLKIEYTCKDNFDWVVDGYSKVLRFTYNRIIENPKLSTKELTQKQKEMKSKPELNSHLCNSAIYDAKAIADANDKPIIFGGKANFIKRCQHKISREEFLKNRKSPIYSVGEANHYGNRLFSIIDDNTILFKPDRKHHYELNLVHIGRNRIKTLEELKKLQDCKSIPITYKLDNRFIYITYDYNELKQYNYKVKQNRIIAIDLNPNYLGYSVVDWKGSNSYQVVESGSFSLKTLNDYQNSLSVSSDDKESQYVNNKRKYEIIQLADRLFEICKHYKCEVFALEDLNFKNKNGNKRSKKLNRLLNNQWLRRLLYNQIKKRILSSCTIFVEVQPQYSSFIGNMVYRNQKLPDECLASIEIGRRGFEFSNQYLFNRCQRQKTVIFPQVDAVKNQLSISLEEIGVGVPVIANWKDIYSAVKKSEKKYRFSISDAISAHSDSLFSKFYKQRYLNVNIFV